MQTKTERLNFLFQEWEKQVPEYKGKFFKDGIIDEQLFDKATLKVLFIAKEPNSTEHESWDFREWWKDEIKYTFSSRIAEWSYGILNNFPIYDKICNSEKDAIEAIKQIAFLNIKKSGGRGNSDKKTMLEHIRKNIKFIHTEIEIIEPEIIITGITWLELRTELFPKLEWRCSGYAIDIARFNKAKVIDFYHPSSRNAPSASYSLLQNIVNSENFKRL